MIQESIQFQITIYKQKNLIFSMINSRQEDLHNIFVNQNLKVTKNKTFQFMNHLQEGLTKVCIQMISGNMETQLKQGLVRLN
jgi:hypothetical protein